MAFFSSMLIGGAITMAVTTYYERTRNGRDVALWQDATQMVQAQWQKLDVRRKQLVVHEQPPVVTLSDGGDVAEGDSLQAIHGIGDVYAATLRSAGITTWAQLAQQSAESLSAILVAAGHRSPANIDSWPTQAAALLATH